MTTEDKIQWGMIIILAVVLQWCILNVAYDRGRADAYREASLTVRALVREAMMDE